MILFIFLKARRFVNEEDYAIGRNISTMGSPNRTLKIIIQQKN